MQHKSCFKSNKQVNTFKMKSIYLLFTLISTPLLSVHAQEPVHRIVFKNQPLNLGECNDGGRFTSVNQAINQAKGIVDCLGDEYIT